MHHDSLFRAQVSVLHTLILDDVTYDGGTVHHKKNSSRDDIGADSRKRPAAAIFFFLI